MFVLQKITKKSLLIQNVFRSSLPNQNFDTGTAGRWRKATALKRSGRACVVATAHR